MQPLACCSVLLLLQLLLAPAWCASPLQRLRHHDHSLPSPLRSLPSSSLITSPTCALNGTACPPPHWPAQWNLTLSTVCQPSTTGYFVPPPSQPWGLVSLDWSVAMSVWKKPNQSDSTVEATSIEGCRRIKAASPHTRCFIYHNMELALQALESQRLVMYDSLYADWFLQYQTPSGMKNGTIYNEPGGPGDQYFWDFRLEAVREYYKYSVLTTLSDDVVDGTFTDDIDGFPVEHDGGPANINMSQADVRDLQYATQLAHAEMLPEIIARGKYNWQAFGAEDDVGPGVSPATCLSFMRARCSAAWQSNAVTMLFDKVNQTQSLAAFLVTRPPVAYLGYGWESDQSDWEPIFLTQVGEPHSNCSEVSAGVFGRTWTYGQVTLDCSTYKAVVPHATGVLVGGEGGGRQQ